MKTSLFIIFGFSFLIMIYSCKKTKVAEATVVDDSALLAAEEHMPVDSKLTEKYKRSCFMCHSNSDAGAPIVKATGMWKERIDQRGLDGLLKNTIEGYNAMPAKGQCLDCTDEELNELIKFMADIK